MREFQASYAFFGVLKLRDSSIYVRTCSKMLHRERMNIMAYITNHVGVAIPQSGKVEKTGRGFWSRVLLRMMQAREAHARRAIAMYGSSTLSQKNSVEADRVQ